MSEEIESRNIDHWISELESLTSEESVSRSIRLRVLLEALISEAPEEALQFLESEGTSEIWEISEFHSLVTRLARGLVSIEKIDLVDRLLQLLASWKLSLDADSSLAVAKALMEAGRLDETKALLSSVLASRKDDVLRQLYELAKLEGDLPGAEGLLIDLVEADPTLPSVSFAHRERKKLPSPTAAKHVKIAILSSYVLDNLALYLEHEGRSIGLDVAVYIAPFGQYTQEILNPASGLHEFQPDITVLALALEDLFPGIEEYPTENDLGVARDEIRNSVRTLAQELHDKTSTLIVLHEFTLMHKSPHGILDTRSPTGLIRWVDQLNHQLADDLVTQERTFLLPLNQIVGWVGKERAGSPKMRYLASMRFADAMLPALAKYTMRYVKPLLGLTRKCIVLDLDGTLWGGIVGELGPEGIHLGPTAPGREFVDFQKALLSLSKRGILLAICSKNNPEDVAAVFESNRYMLLGEDHISATRINWNNKADNIREIATELNIGLDSMIFIDDNPNERELVRQVLPEVLTVEIPRDASLYRSTLENLSDFESFSITTEDIARGQQYRAKKDREAPKQGSTSLEEFYASLNIQVEIRTDHRTELQRLGQMFLKTNQFNLTTKRYQAAEIEELMDSEWHRVYSLIATDRFGDHGTMAAAIVSSEQGTWRIDSFLMSCRVIGYSIERAFLAQICRDARSEGVGTLVDDFILTKKNQPSKDFYSRHGFTLNNELAGVESWKLEVPDATIESPAWVQVV